jgi:hypothetical protein
MFEGVRDDLLLAPLREGQIVRVRFNRGGSSISLRLEFEGGARAAFKPEQTNLQTIPRREIAAYRIDRLLGLGAVPPAVGRAFTLDELLSNLDPESTMYVPRLSEEIIVKDGLVAGELSWWIPVIRRVRIDGYLLDETDGIVTWKRYLTVGATIPDEVRPLVAQVSNMLLFDVVINNMDRWSGRNTMGSQDGSFIYFMDNTMAFGDSPVGHGKVRLYLQRAERFSRSLVMRLRRLTRDEVAASVASDRGPYEFLLSESEIDAVMSRRDTALAYVDALIAEHGEDAVLVFP